MEPTELDGEGQTQGTRLITSMECSLECFMRMGEEVRKGKGEDTGKGFRPKTATMLRRGFP